MEIKSKSTQVNKSPEALFEYLDNLQNFKHLMPPSVEKFEVDGESFVFGIKGMPEIRLVIKERIPYSKFVLAAASSKLDFSLATLIERTGVENSEVEVVFQGDINPMMAMMLKKPLTKFMDGLSDQLGKL
ncbi:MAG: SRPBCC family protein [Flavobacteriaceae bacterium]|nr:SRPBCC family protein [Flavobacteriaceae bacterium]